MLKKTIFLFALLFINVKIVTAQSLSAGPIIGANISTLSDAPNTKNLLGLSIGGFANYSVNEHFGLGAKLLFSQLGTAYIGNTDITRLNYIQLPLTAIYFINETGNQFRPKVFAGFYLGSLLIANNKNGDEVLQSDGQTFYNKGDAGGLLGAGFNYRIMSRTWLNVDGTYSKGFTDVTRNTGNDYKNSALSLNVGLSFPIGK
jgi:outer membrane protein W